MEKARWVDCAGVVNDGKALHSMRDFCSSCSPWWERVPLCPSCGRKAQNRAYGTRQKCLKCKTYFLLEADSER